MIKLPCIEQHIDTTWYQSLSLAVAVGLASAVLLLLNQFTAPAIAQRLQEDKLSAIDLVMPASVYDNPLLDTEQVLSINQQDYVLYSAQNQDGQASGYVLQTAAKGYAGDINLLVGVDQQLNILGVRVLGHSETPGLGDKIEIAKSDWILSFNGLSLANTPKAAWAVKKDGGQFDQFTGATITPRGIVNAVQQGLQDLQHHIQQGEH